METHFLGRRAPLPRKLFSSGVNIKQISFIHAMSRERKKERKKEKKKKILLLPLLLYHNYSRFPLYQYTMIKFNFALFTDEAIFIFFKQINKNLIRKKIVFSTPE